jgi:hypothetical protein
MRETAQGGQAASEGAQQARPEHSTEQRVGRPGCKEMLLLHMTSMGECEKGFANLVHVLSAISRQPRRGPGHVELISGGKRTPSCVGPAGAAGRSRGTLGGD